MWVSSEHRMAFLLRCGRSRRGNPGADLSWGDKMGAAPWDVGSIRGGGGCTCPTRSSAQGNCSAKSLAGDVVNSSLSSLSSLWGVQWGEGGLVGGGGLAGGGGGGGGGGRGHFIHPAIYCTTTWSFALKGLRTMTCLPMCPVRGIIRAGAGQEAAFLLHHGGAMGDIRMIQISFGQN